MKDIQAIELKPFDTLEYHPLTSDIVDTLALTTQSNNEQMFHAMLVYYWGVIATHMRANVVGWYSNKLPLNIYTICLAESGTGKGYTVNTMEEQILKGFRSVFMEDTFPIAAEESLDEIATYRAMKRGTNVDRELERIQKEFDTAGNMLFSFSEGSTAAALKQLRHKLVIANAGSLNFQVDEIGNNLLKSEDLLPACLELYDRGSIKDKLIKNTSENNRNEQLDGFTPMNMLLFGTSSSLLDGSETESKFIKMLESGYARRSFFSFSQEANKETALTAAQIVERMFNQHNDELYEEVSTHLETLADVTNLDRELVIKKDAVYYLVLYKLHCEERAKKLKSHQKILRAELQHRYFKVLKAAAAYSFVDCKTDVSIEYLDYAIKLAEESGKQLEKLLNPDKDFMRLARFLCEQDGEVTLPDIELGLPCFSGSAARKQEMITSAIAWGYRNNVLITKRYVDQILFLNAKQLEETNLDEMIISISDGPAYGYQNDLVEFEQLAELGEVKNMNWINHHVEDEHRLRDCIIPGFNCIVLDVDDGTPIETAMKLLSGYYAVYYDTKSSTPQYNRFRVILPINYVLELEHEDYAEFMTNIINAMPFDIDSAVCEREHKWLTHDAGADVIDHYIDEHGNEQEAKLFDVLEYIPRTTKNEERVKRVKEYENLDGLQYWIMSTTGEGNRNKQLYRYAMVLADKGYDYQSILDSVTQMNKGLKDGISDKEINNTIMRSVARALK